MKLPLFVEGYHIVGPDLAESESDGTLMINMKSFSKEGKYRPDGIKFHNGTFSEKDLIKPNDLVLANTDLTQEGDILGAAVMIPTEYRNKNVVGSHHTTILTLNDERVDPDYLARLINSEKIRIEIKRYRRGATVKGITSNDLKRISIQLPPLAEQKGLHQFSIRPTNSTATCTTLMPCGFGHEVHFSRDVRRCSNQ